MGEERANRCSKGRNSLHAAGVTPSNFEFLRAEWPDLHEPAARAEALAHGDARAACFYARRALELAVHWLYKHDSALKLPYSDQLSALLREPSFRNVLGSTIAAKAVL